MGQTGSLYFLTNIVSNGGKLFTQLLRSKNGMQNVKLMSKKQELDMHWLFLTGAIIMEVCGTTCIKLSQGFTRLWPSILIFVFYALSFTLVTYAVKKLELSITYAIWSGVGTFLIALIGLFWFKEEMTWLKGISMLLVIAGVIGLNLGQSNG
jgi:small multidrug resistance pump